MRPVPRTATADGALPLPDEAPSKKDASRDPADKSQELGELAALLAGKSCAWSGFVERYRPPIRAMVARMLGLRKEWEVSAEDIDDGVQEVFTRLCANDFRLLRSFDPKRSALSTWLSAIARNTTIDLLRQRRIETVPLADDLERRASPAADPSRLAIPASLLTGRQQLVLHLLYDRELSVREVANALSVSEQTVRSTRHKAILRLRQHYGQG